MNSPMEWEERLAYLMFMLAFLFLLITALLLQRLQAPSLSSGDYASQVMLALLWLVIVLESGWQGWLSRRDQPIFRRIALVALLPPMRMGLSRWHNRSQIWLPRRGWCNIDRALRNYLEKRFGLAMIGIALLILPLLALDYLAGERALWPPALSVLYDFGIATIWFAFTFEFVIMVSVAERRLAYCKQHWLDLLIILLPLIAALRTLRLAQFIRVYRLRGVLTKIMQVLIALNWIERLLFSPPRHLRHLRNQRAEKLREARRLRDRIRQLERKIADGYPKKQGATE